MASRRLQAQALLFLVWMWAACRPAASGPEPASAPPAAPHEADFAPGHLLVELRPGVTVGELRVSSGSTARLAAGQAGDDAADHALGGLSLRLVRALAETVPTRDPAGGPIYLFQLPALDSGAATLSALRQVRSDPRVRRAELDHVRRAAALPNDPLFPQQWSLPLTHVPAAWAISEGSEDVVVAILDTGIVDGHPDLSGRLIAGYDFVSDPTNAADGDNRRDSDPTDTGSLDSSRFHGTHVTGIIGATTDNKLGIAGVDRRCRLMPVRVLGVSGGGLDSDISDAVRWASGIQVGLLPRPSHPADVLNLSFGGPTMSFTLQRAMDDALAQGVLIVAAAGNGGADVRTYSPGGLDSVVSVGASGQRGDRAAYSNYGPRVDLLAPGGDDELSDAGELVGILSTYRDDGLEGAPATPPFTYSQLSGTSQAAPHVTGAAALARALWPLLRQPALTALLARSADPHHRCEGSALGGCGAGLLDVEALLKLVKQQVACGCIGDEICVDGQLCAAPPPAHPPLVEDNTVHGGWCSVVWGRRVAPRRELAGSWFLLGLWAMAHLRRGGRDQRYRRREHVCK